MGRVLRAYDHESRRAAMTQDPEGAQARAIEDAIWADTEDHAYFEEAEYDRWKRQAVEDLDEFERKLRARARGAIAPLETSAALVTKRPKSKAKKPAAESTEKKDDKGKDDADVEPARPAEAFGVVMLAAARGDAAEPETVDLEGAKAFTDAEMKMALDGWMANSRQPAWRDVAAFGSEVSDRLLPLARTSGTSSAPDITKYRILVAVNKTPQQVRAAKAIFFARYVFPVYLAYLNSATKEIPEADWIHLRFGLGLYATALGTTSVGGM